MSEDNRALMVFENANIVDGSGNEPFMGSVLIEGDCIKKVSKGEPIIGDYPRIDLNGQCLAPGFIDAHSHMDFYAATQDPAYFKSFTQQGITTFVGGNCGFSPCTIHKNGPHTPLLANTLFEVPDGEAVLCDDFDKFQNKVKQSAIHHNFFEMVGHGSYRTSLSGFESRNLTNAELATLLGQLEQALQKGALGISLGLQYKPGVFVPRSEIIEVARLAKRYDRVMAVHAKAYSCMSGTYPPIPFGRAHNLKAIEDMISVAQETGVRLQFSHLIFVGRKTWKTMDEALGLIAKARARGVDICFDMFPFPFGATLLNTMFPDWFMDKMPGAIKSSWSRLRIKIELAYGLRATGFGYCDMQLTFASSDKYAKFEGKTIAYIANELGQSNTNTLLDILDVSNSRARVLFHTYYGPGMVAKLMTNSAVLFSTDAWPEIKGVQNPAAFGSFPKFIEISRKTKNISLAQCIKKMTSASAIRFNLPNRGLIKEGYKADLVVFDFNSVADQTDNGDSSAAPLGINAVYANGKKISEKIEMSLQTKLVSSDVI